MHDRSESLYRIDPSTCVTMPSVRVKRIEARKTLERRAHALVVRTTNAQGLVPLEVRDRFPNWWYDLRRKQNSIYGGLLRFIDVSILARVPKWALKLIPRWIDEYIDNECPNEAHGDVRSA